MNEQTHETITFVPLANIIESRYQPRTIMDPTELENLANSIHSMGMIQKPTARLLDNGCHELAFGHRRFEAYKILAAQDAAFNTMPLIVRSLTDEQMFDLAWDENNREDLNPIDEGNAYAIWMREFNKTSKEAGLHFETSEENIRAKVRLGNLPEFAKEKVRNGQLNESAGRSLLTLVRMFPGNDFPIKQAIEEIEIQGEKPEDALESVLRTEGRAKIIGGRNDDGHFSMKAKAFKYLPVLTLAEAVKEFELNSERVIWEGYLDALYKGKGPKTHEEYFADNPEALAKLPRIAHLVKPPACTACPLFAQVDGMGYCGWEACFERKREGEQEADLHRVSESTGIAIYRKEDGDKIQLRTHEQKHRAAYDKKHKDLRLLRGGQAYMNFGDIPNDIKVVAVGNLYQTWKKSEEQSKQDRGEPADTVDYERLRAIQQITTAQISLFTWEQALPAFSKLLSGVTCVDLLHRIENDLNTGSVLDFPDGVDRMRSQKVWEKMKKPARLDLLQKRIVFQMLDQQMKYADEQKITKSKTPVSMFAKYLQGLATTWGVKLSKDFMTKAAEHDEAVKLTIAELDEDNGKVAK